MNIERDTFAGMSALLATAVLDDFATIGRAVYAVYAPGRSVPARVREFVKMLTRMFEEETREEREERAEPVQGVQRVARPVRRVRDRASV